MAKSQSNHPLHRIHYRLWADDLHDIVRELQRGQVAPVSENDVLDFLFSRRRQDPETREIMRLIQKSLTRAVELNRRIVSLQRKHAAELEDAIYTDEEDEAILKEALLEQRLLTEY